MAKYYFVLAAFPPISIGVKPELSFKEVKEIIQLNLTLADRKKVVFLFQQLDLYNLKAFWLSLPLDERGTLNSKQLEEALLVRDPFPQYLIDYLDRYETQADRLRYFSSLYVSLYKQAQQYKGFLQRYYRFEREVHLVLTALRAKASQKDLVRELQFEDPQDPLVAEILAQKEGPDYIPPQEYEDLKTLFMENSLEPGALHRAFLEYRFRKIEEMEEGEMFSIDQILGYLARLFLAEEWALLDWERGKVALEELSLNHG